MSQVFNMSGIVTNDTDAFIEDLRQLMKPKCLYCGNGLDGRKMSTKFCDARCYSRHVKGKYKHDEVPTNCEWCRNAIVGRRHGAKYCSVKCRILNCSKSRSP